jgi:hypothetical protein
MWGVTTLLIKQYGEYQLSAVNDHGESIKTRKPIHEKSEAKNLVGLSL